MANLDDKTTYSEEATNTKILALEEELRLLKEVHCLETDSHNGKAKMLSQQVELLTTVVDTQQKKIAQFTNYFWVIGFLILRMMWISNRKGISRAILRVLFGLNWALKGRLLGALPSSRFLIR